MKPPTFRHEAMTTFFEIVIAGQKPEYARTVAAAAFRELDRLEGELSRFIESSVIARANRLARGESVTLTPDAFECLLVAADVALATGQAFDPAYASSAHPNEPGFTLDPATMTLTSRIERLKLDLGAVGKGYALDAMATTLREWQVGSACLNAGGSSVLAVGETAWPTTLGEGKHQRILDLQNASLSASGIAVKGSHLRDPRTGQPAQRTSRVWSLSATAAEADALSTAFFVFDDAEIEAFCARHPQIGAATQGPNGEVIARGALRLT
jgi:thiamine biosynthesis lipoprotein